MSKRDANHWWRSHFEGPPAEETLSSRLDGVERALSLEPRARVLDLACGAGKATIELARRGYRVLGLDPSAPALAEAREAARHQSLNVHFLKSDPRVIPYKEEFDAAVNLFTSFGYFASELDDLKVLEAVRRGLKPGGKLLLDLLNKEWLMRHFEPDAWEQGREDRGAVVLDHASFNLETGRLDSHRTIVAKDGARTPASISLRVYTLTEIKALLAQAGLSYRQAWGGLDGSLYGRDSRRLVVLAERGREAPRLERRVEAHGTIRIKGRRKGR